MRQLGIEFISVFGLPPVDYVHMAADLGCNTISTALAPIDYNPEGYPTYSLRTDAALREEMRAAMRDRGVSIALGEGFLIAPGIDAKSYERDLEAMCEIEAKRISIISFDPDLGRSYDEFGILAEMAIAAGIEPLMEFAPCFSVPDLPTALAAKRHVGLDQFRLIVDTMHLARTGGTPDDIAAIDPDWIGYIQLCDAPLVPDNPDYLDEATFERRAPGEGELPLLDILSAMPRDRIISVEVPLRSKAEAGIAPKERLAPVVTAARRLLDRLN